MHLVLANSKKKLELADDIFACHYNEPLIHQVVNAYMAAGRAGTRAQKTRAEVRGGGAKPWRQKGTGRARAGTIRSPLWRKGGVIFAAKPQCYRQKVNKKMYKGAFRSIISELLRQERLLVVESFTIDAPKTKALLQKLSELKVNHNAATLIVSDSVDENLYLSSRNLPHVEVREVVTSTSDPVAFVKAEKIIMTEAAIKEIEDCLK